MPASRRQYNPRLVVCRSVPIRPHDDNGLSRRNAVSRVSVCICNSPRKLRYIRRTPAFVPARAKPRARPPRDAQWVGLLTRPTNSSIIFGGSPAAGTTVGFGTNVGITPQRSFYQSGRVVSSILYPFGSSRNAMALLPVPCFMGPGSRTIFTPLARNCSQAL